MGFSLVHAILLQVYLVNLIYYVTPERVVCDERREFLCWVDNKCIPKAKVCNFVNDCSNGADEARCGTCEFYLGPRACGLTPVPDRVFGWHQRKPVNFQDVIDAHIGGKEAPLYYMSIQVNSSMRQYIDRHRDDENIIYQPKIILPNLRPTNNDNCRFLFKMLVTERPVQIKGLKVPQMSTVWPEVAVALIEFNGTKSSSSLEEKVRFTQHNVNSTMRERQRGKWWNYRVQIGSRDFVWKLELIVGLKIQSYLVELGSFKFLDCERVYNPPFFSQPEEVNEKLEEDLETACEKGQFKCVISGTCIDQSLVCDFGLDCGPFDRSDEAECDDYPGRCDFEEPSMCDWGSLPLNSWAYMTALEAAQASYGPLPRPRLDHTYLSEQIGGHYVLLNTTELIGHEMARFVGPRVSLLEGASECRLRFWLQTRPGLSQSVWWNASSPPLLQISKELIRPDVLFNNTLAATGGERTNDNWRRYDIKLIDRYKQDGPETLFALLAFGRFEPADFLKYQNFRGYLAIDDVSFTPGCGLHFEGDIVDNLCGEHQFFCQVPTPISLVNCIPLEFYCDFKNDCGVRSQLEPMAGDEIDCAHECDFKEPWLCNHDVIDGNNLISSGQVSHLSKLNEAFEFHMAPVPGYLAISSSGAKFLSALSESKKKSNRDNNSSESTVLDTLNLESLRVELPEFSGAHGGCMFELVYSWTPGAQGILVTIMISSNQLTYETVLKRLKSSASDGKVRPEKLAASDRGEKVQFGIGAQSGAFKLILETSLDKFDPDPDPTMPGAVYEGSFFINSYAFLNCSYPPGVLGAEGATSQVKFDDINDDYGFTEFPISDIPLNTTCAPGYFQCQLPVVCIQEDFVCDLQRDCQGGLDEVNCDQYLRFTFDQSTEDSALRGWSRPDDHLSGENKSLARWTLAGTWDHSVAHSRGSLDSGPPYDHSQSSDSGRFLLMRGLAGQIGRLRSPRLRLGSLAASCRLVFYFYFWGADVNKLELLAIPWNVAPLLRPERDENDDGKKENLLYQLQGSMGQVDAWQRVSLTLNHFDALRSLLLRGFFLEFRAHAGQGGADLIAIDDVSLSPGCWQAAQASDHLAESNLTISKIDGYGGKAEKLVAKGMVALIGLASFGLLLILAAKRRAQYRGGSWRRCLAALSRVTGFTCFNGPIRRPEQEAEIWENSSAASYALQSLPADR